ncbi:M23 family metallopeptidase [Salipaludibacillus agaradhaerens]|uniref:M23 family metallopeptidase n=1 Tax=Salipaludibacillus agaradhaerens TaxID=76935 RepID=UPI00099804DE|nr:M23 family metallopeptidase [Salipaludibacillus agaradhaerens]MCR6119876.1 M23 family metallopeptidase [Salipaludibacillus agaradhaerens]UJW58922.1 M23 family metallopeptidase [Bacillus sp. A116_S68]
MRQIKHTALLILFIMASCVMSFPILSSAALSDDLPLEELYKQRMALYLKTEAETSIPWYYFAAVDSYERGLRRAKKALPKEEGLIAIHIPKEKWVGEMNPNQDDQQLSSIDFFGGIGKDGNSDGLADLENDEDILWTFASYLSTYGFKEKDIRIGLWDYYQRDKAVQMIIGHAKTYKTIGSLNVRERAFPLPLRANYSYNSTWGNARGWGGRRIHEGTDIFANHGVPVKSTTYGIIELKGWNKYGGWRVGIRDTNNVYHYYAHLSAFEKGMDQGTVVKPGDIIGYVGSSGYGKEGTQGKFPPHLHYGMYRDNGFSEWSFDPYPLLKKWEKEEKKRQ